MKPLKQTQIWVLIVVACFLQACGAPVSALTITPTPTPAPIQIPLSQQVTLTSVSLKEEAQSPIYWITALTPRLIGMDDTRVDDFNKAVDNLIQKEIEYFRKNLLAQMPITPISVGSYFDAKYSVISQRGNLWSLKFDFSGYADGAAHPYHYSLALNYDLEHGNKLSLNDLFPKDSNYLEIIARYCVVELSKRDIGFYGGFQQGAEPTPDNYRNWNIAQDGILFTFNEYQVAPYAAGAQTILVPYGELNTLIDRQSPLTVFVP
jgi:hypothetical protein